MEAEIDILRNQGGPPVTKEFKEKFCKIIIEYSHCKFVSFFYLDLTHLTTFLA